MEIGRVFALLLVFGTVLTTSRCTIILDRGNPARAIRESPLMQILESPDEPAKQSASLPFIHMNLEEMLIELEEFNKAISTAMTVEAANIDSGLSALLLCQFARTRMNALTIVNSVKSFMVEMSTLNMQPELPDSGLNSITGNLMSSTPQFSEAFSQMQMDLQGFNEAAYGTQAMTHFSLALASFTELESGLLSNTK